LIAIKDLRITDIDHQAQFHQSAKAASVFTGHLWGCCKWKFIAVNSTQPSYSLSATSKTYQENQLVL